MSLLYVFSATVKQDAFAAFKQGAGTYEKRLAASAPRGWSLRGLYLSSFGFGPAQVELHWEVDSYGAFDTATREHASGGDYAQAVEEVYAQLDLGSQRARVLRSVGAGVEASSRVASLSF